MAIVSIATYTIAGVEFKRRISVLASGMFRATVPPSVIDTLNMPVKYVEADTLDKCERLWRDAVEQAKTAMTDKVKVILYRLSLRGMLLDDKGHEKKFDDISFARGFVLGVEVGVFIKSMRKLADGHKLVSYDFLESAIPRAAVDGNFGIDMLLNKGDTSDGVVELSWTQEREDFFVGVIEGISNMMKQLLKFSKPKTLSKLSAKGPSRKLLTGG